MIYPRELFEEIAFEKRTINNNGNIINGWYDSLIMHIMKIYEALSNRLISEIPVKL